MKQNFTITIESINVTVEKVPVSLKGINIGASCEYTPEEMAVEGGSVVGQVIDQLSEKLGWLKPLVERKIQLELHNDEILSKDFEKRVSEGTQGAYGPNGWFANHETHTTESYDPQKDYSAKTETTEVTEK